MKLDVKYLGRSEVTRTAAAASVTFAPNLARERVFYDGEVAHPLRFREAISALHDVVVGDYRFKRRDKTAYKAWREERGRQDQALRAAAVDATVRAEIERRAQEPFPSDLESQFRKQHAKYWRARVQWASELSRHDPELFRSLVPCDPVVTVAPDVVFFECFAKDESSYGCLLVDREAFKHEGAAGLGTTNVDYSLPLYDHFQTLRSYRSTRLLVDPSGFEVHVDGRDEYREEKIELPPSWLRGFGQLQAAMGLPSRRVTLPREAVYSLLAYLKRHREKAGPRSVRFALTPGKFPELVLDPWGVRIPCRGAVYEGAQPEEIKVWGRRRLMVLARLLPLVERVEVALLGSGLPSVWIAHMGEMRLVLALSGWTTNDWTSGANLDLLSGGFREDASVTEALGGMLRAQHRARFPELSLAVPGTPREVVLGSLHRLCKQGQVMFDFAADCYRWRQVMPVALSESLLGPEHPELVAARELWRGGKVKVSLEQTLEGNRMVVVAQVQGTQVEAILDGDGGFSKAKCECSYFHKTGLRAGPCRHLLALRFRAQVPPAPPSAPVERSAAKKWYQ